VDHKTISNDLGKNCSFAKIPQDLGEHWNEQGVPKTERISVQFS
jgi:hypothetical protein